MILRQFLHTDPAIAASYLVGCAGKGVCVVVDPVAPLEFYAHAAESLAMRITHVIDTHVHADHHSTGPALANAASAVYVLHASVESSHGVVRVSDGDRIEVGNVACDIMHVPGHTPEHIAVVVTDRTRGTEPWLALTGHTLMVGDLGRTELASNAEEGARALFASAQRLKTLPDHVMVLPGAFAGSVCGRALSGNPVSTIGFEHRFNKAFGTVDESEFVAMMLKDIPPAPPRAAETRAANLGALARVA